jgi:hypothetical protein
MLDPIDVADAILHVATQGGRDVKLGAGSRLGMAVTQWMPSLGDKLAARQAGPQPGERPAHASEGALHHPGKSGRTHSHATA